jgi:hypothetical protein
MKKTSYWLFVLLVSAIALAASSCTEKPETPPSTKTSQDCINENGPAFYLNSDKLCEYAQALAIPTSNSIWYTKTVVAGSYDAYFYIHREKTGELTGYGKVYSKVAGYGGWTEGNGTAWSIGVFQWTLAPGNSKTLLISNQTNCTITQISNITPNSPAYPTQFTCTIVSAAGSKSQTFTLQSGVGPFGNL